MATANASTSPTLTSTSHTLSGHSITMPPANADGASAEVLALLESLRPGNRHAFLQPSAAIPTDSLKLVKDTLESFAAQVSDEQQRRIQESRKRKRKGGGGQDDDDGFRGEALKVRKVYVDGFETNQVWQQAKKIIRGVLEHSRNAIDEIEEREEVRAVNGEEQGRSEQEEDEEDEKEAPGTDEELVDEEDLEGEEILDAELLDEEEEEEDDDDGEDLENGVEENEEEDDDDEADENSGQEFVEDVHGLNDGFFSIDEFNKQTQWFEDQDARGDPNTDLASDDEEIDWNADPMAPQRKKTSKNSKSRSKSEEAEDDADEEEEEDDDDEGAPTFGDMDLDAPEGDSEEEDFDAPIEDPEDEGGANANEIYYKDFFAPPPRKSSGNKPKKSSTRFTPKPPAEGDVERAMEDVKRDLFDETDEEDDDASDDDLSDVSAGDPKSRRSAHERRQAKLAEEIRKLEAASIAKREWTLSGEAAAPDRPMNSLLEEDLDFEHGGKPVPVITPEITEDIESMIKRRILAQQFDEVLRRRPDADVPPDTRRGMLPAVDDKKADRGLADIYEEEHVKNSNPDTYVSASDEQLKKEEAEVENLWRNVVAQLDALSSWHYKPKPAAPAITVVADVGTVTMEDAQPSTAQGVAASESRLAPQEVYSTNTAATRDKGEIVTKGGQPLARDELSREDKQRMRRREKERGRKKGDDDDNNGKRKLVGKAKERDDTIKELKKGGVMVINRKGELTDVQGNKPKAVKAVSSGSYKL